MKPSNQRLFLNYRSNQPQHVFLAVVYGMALQGLMVNSRQDWNLEYLVDLREKFLQQEYPWAVINSQFKRALEVDRLDLIFGNPALRKNKKKKVVAPLILTYNPSNPPVKTWIKEGMEILHKDPKLKKVFPNLDVVFRQNKNIRRRIMRNRYTGSSDDREESSSYQPAGCFQLHSSKCKVCERMDEEVTSWKSNKTGRSYTIRRHYTCQTTYCVYLATCHLCQAQYIGQTIRTMQKRHYCHRAEVKTAADGLGEHFNQHAAELGLDVNTDLDTVMTNCSIVIVASVEPDQPWSQTRLDALEADLG